MKKLRYVFVILLFVSCKSTYKTQDFATEKHPKAPNYGNRNSWAVLPNTYPKGLKKYTTVQISNLKADVFYIYPTLNTDKNDIRWNVPIDDVEQQQKILHKVVKYQASPFANSGKIYVPYYRQAHIRAYRMYKGRKEALALAYADVKKAFAYYLEHYNNGRPIILVGHSQGTTHGIQLLKDFFDDKPLQKQLIAAYLPGIRIQPNEFKTIKPMNSPTQTGGFVSWNTRKRGTYPNFKNWYKGSVTTNPITWDAQKTTTFSQHKGFLYSNDVLYPQSLKIEVTDGLIWSTVPKFPKRFVMSFIKNYHVGDINLFWQDIKENVELRTKTWFAKKN